MDCGGLISHDGEWHRELDAPVEIVGRAARIQREGDGEARAESDASDGLVENLPAVVEREIAELRLIQTVE